LGPDRQLTLQITRHALPKKSFKNYLGLAKKETGFRRKARENAKARLSDTCYSATDNAGRNSKIKISIKIAKNKQFGKLCTALCDLWAFELERPSTLVSIYSYI